MIHFQCQCVEGQFPRNPLLRCSSFSFQTSRFPVHLTACVIVFIGTFLPIKMPGYVEQERRVGMDAAQRGVSRPTQYFSQRTYLVLYKVRNPPRHSDTFETESSNLSIRTPFLREMPLQLFQMVSFLMGFDSIASMTQRAQMYSNQILSSEVSVVVTSLFPAPCKVYHHPSTVHIYIIRNYNTTRGSEKFGE